MQSHDPLFPILHRGEPKPIKNVKSMLNFRDDGPLYSSVDYGRFLICPRDKLQSVGSFVVPENMIDVF